MKLVRPHGGTAGRDAVWAECAALSLCRHPGVPEWIGIVNERGRYFIVESLASGAPLSARLSRGRVFSAEEVFRIGASLIDIVGHAASRGVVHNDVRPANVIVGQRVSLVDFGLAEFFDPDVPPSRRMAAAGDDIAGIAEVVIHMLYSNRMLVDARLPKDAPWHEALLIPPAQRSLLLDMFEGRLASFDVLRTRFASSFGR